MRLGFERGEYSMHDEVIERESCGKREGERKRERERR